MTHRQLFERMKKLAKEHSKISNELNNVEYRKYGFNFSDTNDDAIIDCLDYGILDMSFENYKKRMLRYKELSEKEEYNPQKEINQ